MISGLIGPCMKGISRAILALLLLLGGLVSCQDRPADPPAVPPAKDISFTTEDGLALHATVYPADAPSPPGLLLVHGRGTERGEWTGFARDAQREGYMSLAIDLRGHGESAMQDARRVTYQSFLEEEWADAVFDVDAAFTALLEQGADPANIAIIGTDLGATLALRHGAKNDAIQAAVLLSPGLDHEGMKLLDALESFAPRPLLVVTTENDAYASMSAREIIDAAPASAELREYYGSAHGTNILIVSKQATGQILTFLNSVIGPKD